MSEPAPHSEAILAALERLLTWSDIARSPQLSRFLDYIVRHTLNGDEQSIKAYAIAVDVFGRPPDFDPQTDPIVRVQARRLRGLLEQYYAGPGSGERVRIGLPVGRYVPDFVVMAEEDPHTPPLSLPDAAQPSPAQSLPARSGGVTLPWFVLVVLAIGIALAAFALSSWGPRQQTAVGAVGAVQPPSVTILEFQNLAGIGISSPVVAGLAIELVTDLALFEDIDVRYGGTVTTLSPDGRTTDFVLTGIVRPDGPTVQYSAILTDTKTGTVVWNHTISVSATQARNAEVLDLLSRSLSLLLGTTRGPLHAATRDLVAANPDVNEQANVYICRVLFDVYREANSVSAAERVDACLNALAEPQRNEPGVLAMSASLMAEYALSQIPDEAGASDRSVTADRLMQQAIEGAPTSAFVWEQQGWMQQAIGRLDDARRSFSSSLQLNPASPDAIAAHARLLAFAGELDDAQRQSRDVVRGAPNPPPWYFAVPALVALRERDGAAAIVAAERYALADREIGPILAIMAGQLAADDAVVNRYLPEVLDVADFRSDGVLPHLRQRISDDALIEAMRQALAAAGVPAATLSGRS